MAAGKSLRFAKVAVIIDSASRTSGLEFADPPLPLPPPSPSDAAAVVTFASPTAIGVPSRGEKTPPLNTLHAVNGADGGMAFDVSVHVNDGLKSFGAIICTAHSVNAMVAF